MAEVHLDHPGRMSWFPGYTDLPELGPCPHQCAHEHCRAVAYGPDYAHYVLDECQDPHGCNGTCRQWVGEYPHGEGPAFVFGPFVHVGGAL
jgi:hypothetical protein